MPVYTDQIGRTLELKGIPKRIISLVPSQTELLSDLGLEEQIVGITKFCVHPEHLKSSKEIIGGTKKLRFEAIDRLRPDLIIANKEENTQEDIELLAKSYPVYVSDIATPSDCYDFTRAVAEICGKAKEGGMLIERLKFCYSQIENWGNQLSAKKVLYLIWKDPYMAAGTDTYITEMLRLCGLENVIERWGDKGLRYPSITIEEMIDLHPDLILFSSEPYPFNRSHIDEMTVATGLPGKYVDGELFSWYGSRLVHSISEIKDFIHEIE